LIISVILDEEYGSGSFSLIPIQETTQKVN
jgi:hypothetical protein